VTFPQRGPHVLCDRAKVLSRLAVVRDNLLAAEAERDDLIFDALDHGCSEREVAVAAGMSGPAIHYRKAGLKLGKGAGR
jgi:hypothetical protein